MKRFIRLHSKTAAIAIAALSLGFGVARAGGKSYKKCRITNGQVFSCDGSWYQGNAVVLHDGAYHNCRITNGQVFSCDGSWYQGNAVVLHDGAYHTCRITNGQVFSCDGSWYQG